MSRLVWLGAALLLSAAFWGALRWTEGRAALGRLPVLPEFAGKPAVIVRHLREADAAARRTPRSADAVGRLAVAYHADAFYDQAGECYALAQALTPADWRWEYYRVLLDADRGRFDRVRERLRDVVALEPNLAIAWFKLGEEAFKRGDFDEANRAYEQALAVSRGPAPRGMPDLPVHRTHSLSAHARLGLARVALSRNQHEGARQILDRLILLAPAFGPAHRLLGHAYRLLENGAEAERHLAHANVLRPYAPPADPMLDALALESRSSLTLLGHAANADRAGDENWKEMLIDRAAEFDPDNPVVLNEKKLLARARRFAEAASPEALVNAPSERGRALYSSTCAVCHDESGKGQLGKAPPLAGSERLLGPDESLARIVLGGLRGPLTGAAYATEMPSLRLLDDDQIAAVLTYVRGRWGRGRVAIEPALVRRVRRATNERLQPWTYAELEAFK